MSGATQQTYNIEAIKDYCYCPLYYRYKHESPVGRVPVRRDLHYTCLKRVFYFILYAAQGRSYPSRHEVKNAYNRLIKATFKQMAAVMKELDPGTLKRGLEQCLTMHEQLKQYRGRPVLINHNYTIEVGGGRVTGTIDAVLERSRQLELIVLQQDKYEQQSGLVSSDLSLIAAGVACQRLLSRPLNAMGIYYMKQGELETVSLSARDTRIMEATVDGVIRAIKSGIYYPSSGRSCKDCDYHYLCASMKWLTS